MKVERNAIKRVLVALLILTPVFIWAGAKGGTYIDKDAQALDFTHATDMSDFRTVSMQAVYSTVAFTASSIRNGSVSAGNITLTAYHHLDGRASTATITLTAGMNSYAGPLVNQFLTINGKRFTEGVDWTRGMSSTVTMKSLQQAIGSTPEYGASVSSNVITIKSVSSNTVVNSYLLATSSASVLPVVSFAGGQNPATININGTTLTEGTDFNAETSDAVTIENIENAINANATLSAIIVATHPIVTSVVYTSATKNGYFPYQISVSTPSLAVVAFSGGNTSDINVADDSLYEPAHGFSSGLSVLFSTTGAPPASAAPTGLVNQTTYFAIRVDADYYKLAWTAVAASTAGQINIVSQTTGNTNYTVTPLGYVGAATSGFKWQASNDGSNWSDLSVSTVGAHSFKAGGTTVWDFAAYAYRYLRAYFVGPTSGGVDLTITQYGRD